LRNFLAYFFIVAFLSCAVCAEAISSKKASLVVDLDNGKILHANNAHELRYPASLVKMMTLYMTFKEITAGNLSLERKLVVSKKAASMPRTNMSLKAGTYVSVRKAILGLIVHSSNDAAVVLAEAIGGSETNFAHMMNVQAKKLGMSRTTFRNASGLPHKEQKSTAHDLAILAKALKRDFPSFFPWFTVTSFAYNGKTYKSHNRVVQNYEWATGLKTGFTNASGFNIATTAKKDGRHLVGIVLGENTAKERDKLVVSLLNQSFDKNSASIKTASLTKKTVQKNKKNSKNKVKTSKTKKQRA